MVDQKNNNGSIVDMAHSSALLSDETIDELGYARFTATSNTLPEPQSTALSAMIVTGPTKSPPPVLMPRPRPAIHPTLKLTNAFANPEPALSPTPSPSGSVQNDFPEQPSSTYLTPPLAPILKPVASPTTTESLSGIAAMAQQEQQHTQEDASTPPPSQQEQQQQQQQLPFYGKSSPATPSPPPTQPVISAPPISKDSNLNHHQTSNRSGMATQPQSNQSEEQETRQNQHSSTSLTASNDGGQPHGGVLVRKPAVISLAASTSAPLVPSPLVKSTLASQLSSSSSSSSSGSEQQQRQRQDEKDVQQQKQPQPEQKEQQHGQQRRLRKSLSTEQLPKSTRDDFHPPPPPQQQQQQQHVPFSGGNRPPGVEKLIYSGGGKSTLQQLQQEYLLRQNGYLRRQVDALKFDNMESQRQHQELATRMKQLEIQLLEEKKRQTPQQQTRPHEPLMTANEYQHHHYYHHNIFAPLPPPPLHMDQYHSSEEDEEMDVEQRTGDAKEQHAGGNHIAAKKRSGQQTYGIDDGTFVDQQQRQRSQEEYEPTVEEGLPEGKLYMERRHGFSPLITAKKAQQQQKPINQQKRPLLDQRRHSSHITPILSASDSVVSAAQKQQQQQQRPRQRHVTAPSLPHHYRDTDGHEQQEQRGWNRQRSRSVPKNEYLQPSPKSHYRQVHNNRVMAHGNPIYLDDNDNSPHHLHHQHPKGMYQAPQRQQQRFDHHGSELDDTDDEAMDDDLYMARRSGIENDEDYYYDDEDDIDYLQELDFYRYHMTAADPPSMYYPPAPEAFFNDHYATMPPMAPPPPLPLPLPLRRRKSASAMRLAHTGPHGFIDVMNPELYERPLRPPMRRNWNNPQANQLPQMHMASPSPRQQQPHKHRGYSGDPAPYGPRQRGQLAPSTTMSIAPPRSGAAVDHHPPRKTPAMESPRMTTHPLRRPMVARGPSIGSYPGRV